MGTLKARWVPCLFCNERIKLFSMEDRWDIQHIWLHQPSDDVEPYQTCNTAVGFQATPTHNKPQINLC